MPRSVASDRDAEPVGDLPDRSGDFAVLKPDRSKPPSDYTDGRPPWDWSSKYPGEARRKMNFEAVVLGVLLLLFLACAGPCLGMAGQQDYLFALHGVDVHISFRLLAIFFSGCVGGTTFSIKWLVHSIAKGKWHLDRRYWRFFVPMIGGGYACVVMTLFGAGLLASQAAAQNVSMSSTAALAFLIGYFSDGVSGLLSNIANAVFGTLEKK
jgi:hypothetical protein